MKLFEELTQLHGVSGYETAVADYIKEKLAPLADDITTDQTAASSPILRARASTKSA